MKTLNLTIWGQKGVSIRATSVTLYVLFILEQFMDNQRFKYTEAFMALDIYIRISRLIKFKYL